MLGYFTLSNTERPAHDRLNGEEEQVTTVEYGNGEEIKYPQVNAEECEEIKEGERPSLGHLAGHLSYANRSSQSLRRNRTDNEFAQDNEGKLYHAVRVGNRMIRSLEWVDFLHNDIVGGHYADEGAANLLTQYVSGFPNFGSKLYRKYLISPLQLKLDLLATTFLD